MRTKITVEYNNVTVERDDPFSGERRIVTYFAPHAGGYVRIRDRDGHFPQVCEGLRGTGNTLRVSSAIELPALIRRELRRLIANERRELGD